MDGIKDIYTAMQDRIKSPILGSIIIALILANWKLLYVIIFVKMPYLKKFEYFDEYLGTPFLKSGECFWLPIVAGLLFAIVKPWIDVVGAWLYRKPIYIKKSMEAKDAIKLVKQKEKFEEGRARIEELQINTTTSKIDQLQRQLDTLRKMRARNNTDGSIDRATMSVMDSKISNLENEILQLVSN